MIVADEDALRLFSESFSETLKAGDVLLLKGEMGAGKTTFVRYLVAALGSDAHVNSPTYTIVNLYEGAVRVAHMDLYRLESIEGLDLERYFEDDEVISIVEWPEKLGEAVPEGAKWVEILVLGDGGREILLR